MKNNLIDDGSERVHLRVWDLLPWVVNGTASESVLRDVDAHLSGCQHCRAEFVRQQRVHAAMNAEADVALSVERGLERLIEKVDAHEQQAARYGRADGMGRSRWAWIAYGLAAMVLLEAGGLVGLGALHRRGTYHTLSAPDAGLPQAAIRLVLDPSMTVGKLQALLVPMNLQIVGGPNEDGVYTLGTLRRGHGPDIESDIATLRVTQGVRFVEPAEAARNEP